MQTMNKKNTALAKEKTNGKTIYKYEDFKNIIRFLSDLAFVKAIFTDSPYLLENGKKNLYAQEFKKIKFLEDNIKGWPESAADLRYAISQTENLERVKYLFEKATSLQIVLDKVKDAVIRKSLYQTELGHRLLNKSIKIIKRFGGNGATMVGTQVASILGTREGITMFPEYNFKQSRVLYIDIDTENMTERISAASCNIGDAENIFFSLFKETPLAKLRNKTDYTRNLMLRNSRETRDKEFLQYLYRPLQADSQINLFNFLRLGSVNSSNSLSLVLRLFVDFASQLDNYDVIIIDEGAINTLSHGFLSYYLRNHILTIPFDDFTVSRLLVNQTAEMRNTPDIYKEMVVELQNMYSFLENNHTIEHNVILALNERNSTETTKERTTRNYQKSRFFTLLESKQAEYDQYFQNRVSRDKNKKPLANFSLNTVPALIPFYWQPYLDEDKKGQVNLPLITKCLGKEINTVYNQALGNIANVIAQLTKGISLADIKNPEHKKGQPK